MRAVDTNVLVRLVTRDDAKQVAAAETYIAKGVWVSLLALAETAWVLHVSYQRTAATIAESIAMLLEHEHLRFQDADVISATLELYRRQPSLGFSDCLLLEVARKSGHLPLGTFDRDLGKLEGTERL